MMFDFDYADRAEQNQQNEEYEKLTKKIDEISAMLTVLEKKKRERAIEKKHTAGGSGKVSRKRKRKDWEDRFDQSIGEYINGIDEYIKKHEKIITEETRRARVVKSESVLKKMAATEARKKSAEQRKKAHEEEMKVKKAEQLEVEQKREKAAEKRAEELRIQREVDEEKQRQFEEEEKKQKEIQRMKEEELKKRQEEEFRKEQEIRAVLMRKIEEKRRAEEEKRRKEDLEQIQKQIEAKRKDVEAVEVRPQVVASTSYVEYSEAESNSFVFRFPAIIYQKEFNYIKVARPKEFEEFKGMIYLILRNTHLFQKYTGNAIISRLT